MNIKELIDKKGFPKIFFDSNSKNNQPFCIYELEEEIILNSNGCFLNGKKINQEPFKILQDCIAKWKKSSNQISCIGFCSYNLKDYLFTHINFKKNNDFIPFYWFAKPKKIYFLDKTDFKIDKVKLYQYNQDETFTNYKKNITSIKSKLKSGDVYQVNYTYTKKLKLQMTLIMFIFLLEILPNQNMDGILILIHFKF